MLSYANHTDDINRDADSRRFADILVIFAVLYMITLFLWVCLKYDVIRPIRASAPAGAPQARSGQQTQSNPGTEAETLTHSQPDSGGSVQRPPPLAGESVELESPPTTAIHNKVDNDIDQAKPECRGTE
ncbi:hypothetical protein F5J12DRAFT_890116 [Pisolithus orientalis]|uniref:uncharacterized protein n=1 Tax=Pisolithus orientalis TaxID=936130 RepID=UPI002224BD12|nr:uncharacterized protein F5J12DRAFT_890116 [Pisolithus orientalis]KAI6019813.1 hypothetical protein F5J12DRAFT_890116 [Pisolithus orientalis]